MRLFGKTKQAEPAEEPQEVAQPEVKPVPANMGNVEAQLTRMSAQMESFGEQRKVFGERFSRINEMIGELRGMIIETNKDLQQIQIKSTQAADLVKTVEPDKMMMQLRKQDVKIDVLKANIESNEARMDTILKELKELRNKVNVFRGIDEIVKLSEEVKNELINIRKVKTVAERHSDKIESMFIDFQKRVMEITELEDAVKQNTGGTNRLMKDFDEVKLKNSQKAEKKDLDKLITTSKDFENHTTKAISLLNKVFIEFEEEMTKEFKDKIKRLETLEAVLKDLTKDSPHLEKNLEELKNLLKKKIEDEQKKAKIKKKQGFGTWLVSKVSKKPEEKDDSDDEIDVDAITADQDE